MADPIKLAVGIPCASFDSARVRQTDINKSRLRNAGIERVAVAEGTRDEQRWNTAKRAWKMALASDATHIFYMEDDVALSENIIPNLKRAIRARPDHPISPFLIRKNLVERARSAGVSWTRLNGFWGQGIVMPADHAAAMLRWSAECVSPEMAFMDIRPSLYQAEVWGEPVWATVPSLVEHVGANNSLIGHGSLHDRTATWFDPDPGEIDFTNTDREAIPSERSYDFHKRDSVRKHLAADALDHTADEYLPEVSP